MVSLLAQADASPISSSTWERLGTAGIVAIVLLAVITWLLRERTRLLGELAESQGRERDLSSQLLEQSQKLIPISEHLATVTEAASEALMRDRLRHQEGA